MGAKEEAGQAYMKTLPEGCVGTATLLLDFNAGWDAAVAHTRQDLPTREEVAKAIFGTLEESVAFDWDDVAEEFRESVRVSAAAVLALLGGGE